ncbi:MAG TPA: DUF2189 domain-containing protein [Reyranella sp.]|nr:DUF2189 domain-containing protein [Reyranella sp.]
MQDIVDVFQSPQPRVRRVPVDRAWRWLGLGWRDFRVAPRQSFAWGMVPVVAGWLAAALLAWFDLPYLLLPLGAGFFFLGPFLAGCFYEISRRHEQRLHIDVESVAFAWKRNAEQIALMGVLLLVFHLVWMRLAQLLFAIFAWRSIPSWDRFADLLWYSSHSLPFLALGTLLGAALAAIAFTVAAFALPYLLDRRNANLFEAIATSVAAVRLNVRPMLLWAVLIVFLTGLGMVPGLLGLAIALPVIGHATWHAYRDIVVFVDE